jgi:hypothetical protein
MDFLKKLKSKSFYSAICSNERSSEPQGFPGMAAFGKGFRSVSGSIVFKGRPQGAEAYQYLLYFQLLIRSNATK